MTTPSRRELLRAAGRCPARHRPHAHIWARVAFVAIFVVAIAAVAWVKHVP